MNHTLLIEPQLAGLEVVNGTIKVSVINAWINTKPPPAAFYQVGDTIRFLYGDNCATRLDVTVIGEE